MASYTVTRVQDPRQAAIQDIVPKNWHRFPPRIADPTRIFVPVVSFTGGAPNVGAQGGNMGESGTINSTSNSRGQAWNTQAEKSATLNLPLAADVGKSYGAQPRGAIEPKERYPSANTAEVPAAFREAQYIVPGTP